MFIDYNLYGMNMLNVAAVKFRRKREDGKITTVLEVVIHFRMLSVPHHEGWGHVVYP